MGHIQYVRHYVAFEFMSHSGLWPIRYYVAFGIMSHSRLFRIQNYVVRDCVVRDYVAFGIMSFGIMSHLGLYILHWDLYQSRLCHSG